MIAAMAYEHIQVEIEPPIATVTLNRPKVLNALSPALMQEMTSALASLDGDETVRAVGLTGGPKVFAAGADIGDMADRSAVEHLHRHRTGRAARGWGRRGCSKRSRRRSRRAWRPSARASTSCLRPTTRRKACTRSSKSEKAYSKAGRRDKRWQLKSKSTFRRTHTTESA